MAGRGRGGRGSLLLKALGEPVRKPGADGDGPMDNISVKPVGGGRGSYLLNLIPSEFIDAQPKGSNVHEERSAVPEPSTASGTSKAVGRGAALLEMCGPSPPRPVRQVKPLTAPVDALQSLSITDHSKQSTTNSLALKKPKGTQGDCLKISANYIKLRAKSSVWYQYSVSYSPIVDSIGMRYKLLYSHSDIIGPARVFDGNTLFLPNELPHKVNTLYSVHPITGQQVTVQVSFVTTISIASRQCIQMYNVLFKRIMNILGMVQIGKGASFDQRNAISVPQHRLQVWPGYVTSIEEYEGGLHLLCDVSHKVLREQTAYDVMAEIYSNQSIPNQEKKSAVFKTLIGQTIITRYNNKTYRVDDIDFDSNPASSFERKDGPISYRDYYKTQYGLEIRDLAQPMLLSRPKRKDLKTGEKKEMLTYIVPEIAHMTGLTDDMRQNFKVMKDIALHTRVTPQVRQFAVRKLLENIVNSKEASDQLAMWGLELDRDTVQMDARYFPPESIYLGGNYMGTAGPNADWTRDVTNNAVIQHVDLKNWVMVYPSRDKDSAVNYLNSYKKLGPQLGIMVEAPHQIPLSDDRVDSYVKAVRDSINSNVQLVVVLFSTKREDKYNAVKKLLCAERPCPSQMIISRTISDPKKLRSVVTKISLQINAKLGGELWRLAIPLNNTMYIGIDVYHDGAKGKGRSVTGFVASVNKSASRYYSLVTTQAAGEELSNGLKTCLIASLKQYHSINGILPDKIVVYRDGVSNSMMEHVVEHEVKHLQSSFETFEQYRLSPPGLVVVVVQKRINTRLFSAVRQGYENPPPGTILDHTVTKSNMYDFYLVSQHVTQGTVTPTRYVVVQDNTELKSDHLQKLTYKLCHMYYNWSGTIRVPAPCQYAHKLAYLIGENVRRDPSPELADKLYYL